MMNTKQLTHDGRGKASITDGRVSMTVDDRDAGIYFNTVENTPLSSTVKLAEIKISGVDWEARIDLDGEELDALADAIHHAQEKHR